MKTQMIIKRAALLSMMLGMAAFNATAQNNYYWNPDDPTGSGSWTGTVWSPDETGLTRSATTTTAADNIHFAATGVPSGTVTVSGAQLANNIYLNQSDLLITGGTVSFSGTMFLNASTTIDSYVNFKTIDTSVANLTLTLNGGGNLSGGNTGNQGATTTIIFNTGSYTVNNNSWRLNYGDVNAGTGGVKINEGAVLNALGLFWIGYSNGLLTIDGGRLEGAGNIAVGRGGNGGRIILNSGTLLSTVNNANNALDIGFQANARLDVNGGLLRANYLNIGNLNNAAQTAAVNLAGGVSEVGAITLGFGYGSAGTNGTASLNVSGGLLKIGAGGIIYRGADTNTMKYAITLSGGTVGMLASDWSTELDITLAKGANGNVTFSAVTPSFDGRTITLAGKLTGSGGLNVGGGTLLLSGANDYSGQTVIDSGAALTLTGTHTLGLAVLTEPAYVLNGALDVTLGQIILDFNGLSPSAGESWTLFSGNLANLDFGASTNWLSGFSLDSGDVWKNAADYYFDTGSGILSYGMIPEPSTWALLLGGAALLAVLRRRK